MSLDAILQRVLEEVAPTKEEQAKVDAISRRVERQIADAAESQGVNAVVRVEGSIAKGTWLAQGPDIDVFVRLPTSIPRSSLGDVGLKIAKAAAGDAETLERFAEHPYLEVYVDGYKVDIVPCYDAEVGVWQSATDRTPFHTDYINSRLPPQLRDEVRLLKRFLKGVGVYGAEIKVGGFSGYLCELLVMKYGSFTRVVEAFAAYSKRVVIDIEGAYAGRERELELLFSEPLVIVDPVDRARNVASAVQPQKLYEFVAAARAFHTQPSEDFFFPPKTHALSPDLVEHHLEAETSAHLYLTVGELTAVPDVLWGQIYRTKRSLRKLLEVNDFKVLRDASWSNETSLTVFIFELEQNILPNVKKHLGPQLERATECSRYLAKYRSVPSVTAGPYIEDGRWVVELKRKYTDADALFRDKLADGGKNCGVADLIAEALKFGFEVLLDEGILKVYTENSDFAVFLTEYLKGKPFWLK